MITKEQIAEAAEQYAEQENSAWTNDYYGFVAGANFVLQNLQQCNVIRIFPDNVEIWKWWQTQKFQKEQGEQEYTMIYEIDLPKILKAFTEQFSNCV